MSGQLTVNTIFSISPEELLELLAEEYPILLPESVETADDMKEAAKLLSFYTSHYIFFSNMAMEANAIKRRLKRDKADKSIIDDAISRETILNTYADMMKSSYNTVSRMVTIKIQVDQELRMSEVRQ